MKILFAHPVCTIGQLHSTFGLYNIWHIMEYTAINYSFVLHRKSMAVYDLNSHCLWTVIIRCVFRVRYGSSFYSSPLFTTSILSVLIGSNLNILICGWFIFLSHGVDSIIYALGNSRNFVKNVIDIYGEQYAVFDTVMQKREKLWKSIQRKHRRVIFTFCQTIYPNPCCYWEFRDVLM